LTVTYIPAVVESKSRFDRAESSRSCSRDTASRRTAKPGWRGVSVVHLLRQADQVLHGHECAYANESCQADGEENPQKPRQQYESGLQVANKVALAELETLLPDIAALPIHQRDGALAHLAQSDPQRFLQAAAKMQQIG
jgi:hypothetical protein